MLNYSSLQENPDHDEEGGSVMVHVAEPSRARWNHIEHLDTFFSRMYQYHQKHGFLCMCLQEILELLQFVFVIFLTSYVIYGVDYPLLFKDTELPKNKTKIALSDVILPFNECISNFTFITWLLVIVALIIWILKTIKGIYYMFHFWDIKQFYNIALNINDNDLDNLTWHQVQTRIRAVQTEQQMCIHKNELTELDIYHRILRKENYLIAMVNKRLLPPRLKVPFFGEYIYWTTALEYNILLLFFWSPWSLFENPWHLRDEYKKTNLRHDLAKRFAKLILWLVILNVIFAPLILLWQILYTVLNYAAVIRKEPAILVVRRWSLYGRLYLRHFNELEHELEARLARAHKPATKYLASYTSPLAQIIAESMGFYATALLTIFVFLSIYDEDVLTVEHVLTVITILTTCVAILRTFTPDTARIPIDAQTLLNNVVVHTHYLPEGWVDGAHTNEMRKQFEQLFQYGFLALLEAVISPILTPFLLMVFVYPRALDIVDFFRNFTVEVQGVGDVCSFAQMNIKRHGNPDWHEKTNRPEGTLPTQYEQGEDGKVELSLMHFTCMNPKWRPPQQESLDFVEDVQQKTSVVQPDAGEQHDELEQRIEQQINDSIYRVNCGVHASGGMSRIEGVSPLESLKEMTQSISYLHNLHNTRTRTMRPNTNRSNAEETTPLLASTVNH